MNKKLRELLPKKECTEKYTPYVYGYITGFNECHDLFTAALEKHEIAVVPSEEELEKIVSASDGVLGRYLNTMVSDLGIMNKGEYLRDLFKPYSKAVARALRDLMLGRGEK